MDQFPPNSQKSKGAGPKRVERVTSTAVRRKRQPLGKQFRQTFFNGDARMAAEYMVVNSIIPAAKEMMVDAVNAGLERLIYGENRHRRSGGSGPLGYVAYNRMSQRGPEPPRNQPQQAMSRPNRMRHAFDQIVINSRQEAEEVLDRMYDLISRYDSASVADLYELTGIQSSHTDQKWGWEDLHGSGVGRVRGGGYLLELPEPISLG
jgi:hypothetical protein